MRLTRPTNGPSRLKRELQKEHRKQIFRRLRIVIDALFIFCSFNHDHSIFIVVAMMFARNVTRKCEREWIRQCRHLRYSGTFTRRYQSTQLDNDDSNVDVIQELPWQYLRASNPGNYDKVTYQRNDVIYNMETGKPILDQSTDLQRKPKLQNVSIQKDATYQLEWSDGTRSNHPIASIHDEYNRWQQHSPETRVLWSGLTAERVRSTHLSMPFEDLMTDSGMKEAILTLYEYGILLVTNTPIPQDDSDDGAGIAAVGAALGGGKYKRIPSNSVWANYQKGGKEISLPHATDGPLRTLYGTVWSTVSQGQSEGASVADSAYGQDALPLHTDMTYLRDPPGLQIFTMVQPALQGGESLFGDGFAVARQLRDTNPKAFEILSQTVRRYRCRDDAAGWHLEASGPVIQLCPRGHEIVCIRHNDLDRLPDLPPKGIEKVDEFYQELQDAHNAWDSLLAKDENRLVIKLEPGETMVVANQVSQIFQSVSFCVRDLTVYCNSTLAMYAWSIQLCIGFGSSKIGDGLLYWSR